MSSTLTTLTERGQVSIPVALRKQLQLKPGQPLLWEKISRDECRIRVIRTDKSHSAPSMRGFMKRLHKGVALPRTTNAWMKLLREGE